MLLRIAFAFEFNFFSLHILELNVEDVITWAFQRRKKRYEGGGRGRKNGNNIRPNRNNVVVGERARKELLFALGSCFRAALGGWCNEQEQTSCWALMASVDARLCFVAIHVNVSRISSVLMKLFGFENGERRGNLDVSIQVADFSWFREIWHATLAIIRP